MAFLWIFASALLFSLAYCEAEPENCTPCKLFPIGEDFASEFRLKSSEKGVRLVYLNLKIGNDSYNPLELQDEFLPAKWVWANTINEPMLSLPDDYAVLSLGLLNFQFRNMDIHLKDQPSGCLARLNSSCQNIAVGRMLLEHVTTEDIGELSHKTQVVCVAMIKSVDSNELNKTEYHCCGMQTVKANGSLIRCDITVDNYSWVHTFNAIFILLSVFMAFYIPALPLALPDCGFSLQYECDKVDRMEQVANSHTRNGYIQINQTEEEEADLIPVDDASPITFSTFLIGCIARLSDVRFSFNIKLAIMWFCVYPCAWYAQMGLYSGYVQKEYMDESVKKHVPFILSDSLLDGQIQIFLAVVTLMVLIPVLLMRPKDFILDKDIPCFICHHIKGLPSDSSDRSVSDELCRHFKILHQNLHNSIECCAELFVLGYKSFLCLQCLGVKINRCTRPVCVLWSLVCIFPTLCVVVAWGAICLICFFLLLLGYIVLFSPLVSLFSCFPTMFLAMTIKTCTRGTASRPLKVVIVVFFSICFLIFVVLFLVQFVYNFCMLLLSCIFFTSVLGFTIVGLVLNADIVTPYAAFFLVVTTNIYLCYANLQNRYKVVKRMTLKWKHELQINSSDPKGTIPSKLFWFVCDKALPIKTEFSLMFRNVVLIVAFLFLVVYSIVFFGNQYNISAVFSTIAVFVSGIIPALVLKGLTTENMFMGWEKIKLKREIETAAREFQQENRGNSRGEGRQLQSINNADTLV